MPASPKGWRYHLLDVTGIIVNDRLKMDVLFSEKIHDEQTMKQLLDHFMSSLRELIQHCLDPNAGGYTPSDFGLVDLDEDELGSILDELE